MAFGERLKRRLYRSKSHPDFDAVAQKLAKERGISLDNAKAILAARTKSKTQQ